jgi:hypothetical protein
VGRLIDRLKNISGGVIRPAGKIKEKFNDKPIKRLLQDTLERPFLWGVQNMETRTFLLGLVVLTMNVPFCCDATGKSELSYEGAEFEHPLTVVQLEGIKTFHSPVRIRYPPIGR